MAARVTSAFYHFTLILHLFLLINYNYGERIGDNARTLYINEDKENLRYRRSVIIDRDNDDFVSERTSFLRKRRDVADNVSTTEATLQNKFKNAVSRCCLSN
ncbi:hypothetical protein PV327_007134 [Microctonus hyperodae]|uniref:Uncharacterized protein n=1 Tax=Microctonus hyperodae TaxID=165561 RepID=A0AA39F5X7_MICHY|nr:hypothetical protein PV327_007134 [Microctonus hyperodae]